MTSKDVTPRRVASKFSNPSSVVSLPRPECTTDQSRSQVAGPGGTGRFRPPRFGNPATGASATDWLRRIGGSAIQPSTMADILTRRQRSERMALIRRTDTKPELLVRRIARLSGHRFRVDDRSLPGAPDLAFHGLRRAVFVHGCFWHQHSGCRHAAVPSSRKTYWLPKLARNRERDQIAQSALRRLGWHVLVLWECELVAAHRLTRRLIRFLED